MQSCRMLLARQTVLSMQLKEIKYRLLEGLQMRRIFEGKLVCSLLLKRLNSSQNEKCVIRLSIKVCIDL